MVMKQHYFQYFFNQRYISTEVYFREITNIHRWDMVLPFLHVLSIALKIYRMVVNYKSCFV